VLINTLGSTRDYQKDISDFIYSLAYLFQKNESKTYDYFFTSELNSAKPMLLYQINITDKDGTAGRERDITEGLVKKNDARISIESAGKEDENNTIY